MAWLLVILQHAFIADGHLTSITEILHRLVAVSGTDYRSMYWRSNVVDDVFKAHNLQADSIKRLKGRKSR